MTYALWKDIFKIRCQYAKRFSPPSLPHLIMNFLYLRALIEVYILFRKQLNRHVVHRIHLLLQHKSAEESINAVIALHISVLCNEEGDTSLTHALRILRHHIIAHNLYVPTGCLQQELTNDMRL